MKRTLLLAALAGCVLDDPALSTSTAYGLCDGCPSVPLSQVWFSYSATQTNDATANTTNRRTTLLQAGTSIRVGTCGMTDATHSGPSRLRLWNVTTNTEITEVAQSHCGLVDRDGTGVQLNYTVPYDMIVEVRAGCIGAASCSGEVVVTRRLDATPRLFNVKYAFTQILQSNPSLLKSPDLDWRINGISYVGHSYDGKYHFQGIARTYNRANHDIVWSTSIDREDTATVDTVFFSKLGSKPTRTLVQRFGGNYGGPVNLDKIEYASNAGVSGPGIPAGRKLDHTGGLQSIGNYVFAPSEFVKLECTLLDPTCPAHGDHNIPASGQTSQIVGYDISAAAPVPRLLIEREHLGAGWVAIGKLPVTAKVPTTLQAGYLMLVPDGNRISIYALAADGCTGYASLSDVLPYRGAALRVPNRSCVFPSSRSPDTVGDARPVDLVGCIKRGDTDPDCPELEVMYADGDKLEGLAPFQFPNQDDIQSANFVTQTDGTLYLIAMVGFPDGTFGPNSESQLWRVVFGTPTGMSGALPDGSTCQQYLCLVREGTEAARDSFKNMETLGINGNMFRYGGGAYIAPSSNPANERIFLYGTEHYLEDSPRAALFNEF